MLSNLLVSFNSQRIWREEYEAANLELCWTMKRQDP